MLRVSEEKGSTIAGTRYIFDLDAEEILAERVARLLAQQAGVRASSAPENSMIRQSPHLSSKSGQSAGSEMRSGSQPHTHKLTFTDAIASAATPEEQKEQGRLEARTRRSTHRKPSPKEGKERKKGGKEPNRHSGPHSCISPCSPRLGSGHSSPINRKTPRPPKCYGLGFI